MRGCENAAKSCCTSAVEYLCGSRTVSYDPPRHIGVGFNYGF